MTIKQHLKKLTSFQVIWNGSNVNNKLTNLFFSRDEFHLVAVQTNNELMRPNLLSGDSEGVSKLTTRGNATNVLNYVSCRRSVWDTRSKVGHYMV